AVKVIKSGLYEVRVLRWPAESKTPIQSPLMPGKNVPGASNAFRANEGTAIPCTHAVLRIDGNDLKTIPVRPEDAMVSFRVSLEKGSHQLAPFFKTSRGEVGCFYAVVTKLD
ncbi:MAG: arylsulfatase, partial [Pirellulaceae bacterium]|nr:arylsulfatase [Pirellulaceae bacterium]